MTDDMESLEKLMAELIESRGNEKKYRQIFENMTNGCALHEIICDAQGKPVDYRYLELNPAFEKLTGVPCSALLGKTIREVLPDTEEYWIETFGKVALTGEPVAYENFSRELGKYYDTWVFSPQKNQFAVIFSDITDRKRAESALREAEEKYRNIFENAIEGFFQTTLEGRMLMVNSAFAKMFGYDSPGELMNEVEDISKLYESKEDRGKLVSILSEQKIVKGFEAKALRKDGSVFWVSSNVKLVRDEKGDGSYLEGSLIDITERKVYEKQIIQAQKLESLGVLAGGIAHDFNNILTAILGNISLAKSMGDSKEELMTRLAEAEKASLRASGLAQQLLTFSKGGHPIKKLISIEDVIEHSVKFALTGSNIQCHYSFQKGLWPARADEGQMGQVFQNLIINAKQAMGSGGTIRISVKNLSLQQEGEEVKERNLRKGEFLFISIQDQGIGIPAEVIPRVFDPYFTTKTKGSGLGLSICHSIIQSHQGYISLESNLGVGTTFYIYLPASPEVVLPVKKETSESLIRGNERILLMDDEESILTIAGDMLKQLGYEVETAKNVIEVLEKFKMKKESGHPFDLVITDLTVPGESGGMEALKRLKEIDPKIKVIVSSGYSNDPALSQFKSFGFSECLRKPYRAFEMSEIVKKVLNEEVRDE